eukprot:12928546-Prorocentrum_lima.AAC.1
MRDIPARLAILFAVRAAHQQRTRGEPLKVAGALHQLTLSSLKVVPVWEDASLPELPPTSGEMKVVWDRAT